MKNSELQICCRVRGNGLRMVLVFGTKLLIILLFIRGAADLASVPMCTPACKLRSTSSVFVVPRSSQCCEHPRIAASRWRFTVTSFPCCSPGGNRWRDKLCNIDAVTDEECAVVVDGRAFALAEEDLRAGPYKSGQKSWLFAEVILGILSPRLCGGFCFFPSSPLA